MPHLHVALVTERPEASLIPILQLRPQQIWLVADRQRRQAAERLHILLQHELSSPTRIRILDDLPENDPQRISSYAARLADTLQQQRASTPGLHVTYDLADSNKLTTLLFQQAMRHCDAEWLYIDARAGTLYRMDPEFQPTSLQAHAIESVLDIDIYLQANGRKRVKALSDSTTWQTAAGQRKPLTRYLAHQADKLAGLMGEFHELVHGKGGVIEEPSPREGPRLNTAARQQWLGHPPRFPCTDALTQLNDAGLLEWTSDQPRRVAFPTLEGALYLGGAWLTEYVWHCARDAGLAHIACTAHILDLSGQHNGAPVVSDCLAMHHNQLLFIECLTTRPGPEACLSQGLRKLHEIPEHSAGLAGTSVLIACGEFDKAHQHLTDIRRTQGLKVEVMESAALKYLPDHFKSWMESGRWSIT
ncbi:Card1-like endonuclease domain-containing protein [Billgrantia endophytica]|uniref:Card1 endonuclease domain-containing protein n=1 Tax=Billgrantia endophytica TaxID=2033802 RepID=A0A2N7UBM5_9GAMM|nr:DUF1887 family CARF protein [Halomonas endophytica]PMR77820.1 hypothetical protein C1H69_01250 [Halomonas endophytica]